MCRTDAGTNTGTNTNKSTNTDTGSCTGPATICTSIVIYKPSQSFLTESQVYFGSSKQKRGRWE